MYMDGLFQCTSKMHCWFSKHHGLLKITSVLCLSGAGPNCMGLLDAYQSIHDCGYSHMLARTLGRVTAATNTAKLQLKQTRRAAGAG